MAYVSISAGLVTDVKQNIATMRDAERKPYMQSIEITLNPDGSFIEELCWGEHLHLKSVIPPEFLSAAGGISVMYEDKTDDGCEFVKTFNIMFNHRTPLPAKVLGYNNRVQIKNLTHPEIKEYIDKSRADRSIMDRWDRVMEQVTEFLKNCKSLNEGLKLWPQLAMYIPASDIERVNRKNDKEKKASGAASALASMDTDMLISSAVIARMSGAVLA